MEQRFENPAIGLYDPICECRPVIPPVRIFHNDARNIFRLSFAYGKRTGINDQDEAVRSDMLRVQGVAAT
jgi:hypothetical protein